MVEPGFGETKIDGKDILYCMLLPLVLRCSIECPYLPVAQFGHGSRSCIGKNIALLEITKLVPQILREFDVSWASPKKEWTTESYWFCMQKDVVFRFTARDGGKAEE